uniref:Uncharacterized protein n=1 Tax=Ditylenchus dipsaci TaxID=166011 RepID=A0A915CKJ9_9BILA
MIALLTPKPEFTRIARYLQKSYASKSNLLNTNSTHGRAKDSVQAIAGAALFNPEPLLKPNPVDSLPSSQSNIQKRSIWSNELLQFDPMANVAEQKMEAEKQEAYIEHLP